MSFLLSQNLGSEAITAEESTLAELERVFYAQMLIIFAPHAVPAIAHVPLLLSTLKSRQPALRKAAADTMRHLAGLSHSVIGAKSYKLYCLVRTGFDGSFAQAHRHGW